VRVGYYGIRLDFVSESSHCCVVRNFSSQERARRKGGAMLGENSARRLLSGFLLVLFVLPHPAFAYITFQRTYGTTLWDQGFSVQQTADGGYIIAGDWQYDMKGTGTGPMCLIKTDSLGDTLWIGTYGDTTMYSEGHSVQQTSDGGYIIVGYTHPVTGLNCDVYAVKTDSCGEPVWTRKYGGAETNVGNSVQQTSDGGYVIAGFTGSFSGPPGEPPYQVYLIKTDALGETLWTRTYDDGDTFPEYGFAVAQTFDGGYIIAGNADVYSNLGDVYLVKTDTFGHKLWEREYGGITTLENGRSVLQTPDSGYVVVGCTDCFTLGDDVYLIKTDACGDTQWTRRYGGPDIDEGYFVAQTSDGGYAIAGATSSFSSVNDAYLIKTDSLGNTLWTRVYGGDDSERGRSVRQTSDGGYVVAGYTASFGAGQTDVYLVKTDQNGLIGMEKDGGVLSLDEPPDTVFTDSTYAVAAAVRNFGNLTVTFDVTVTIDGYADTAKVQDLDPGLSTRVTFGDWQVPSADSTVYTLIVCTHLIDDIDSTNDCKQKTIFAYNPIGVAEKLSHRPRGGIFGLSQNEPNPFYKSTMISYSLPTACHVTLKVYDTTGRPVETLVDQNQEAGAYELRWRAENRACGIYFCRLQAGEKSATRKMISLR
jgi:hypothetical protein